VRLPKPLEGVGVKLPQPTASGGVRLSPTFRRLPQTPRRQRSEAPLQPLTGDTIIIVFMLITFLFRKT